MPPLPGVFTDEDKYLFDVRSPYMYHTYHGLRPDCQPQPATERPSPPSPQARLVTIFILLLPQLMGYIVIENALSPAEVAVLNAEVDRTAAEQGGMQEYPRRLSGPGPNAGPEVPTTALAGDPAMDPEGRPEGRHRMDVGGFTHTNLSARTTFPTRRHDLTIWYMTSKRVSAPFDLKKNPSSSDDLPKKQAVATVQRPLPPHKTFTNGLFKPLSDKQIDMLEREYYTNKNMVGRDKLFFILKRKHGDKAPTQKAINDWLFNQDDQPSVQKTFSVFLLLSEFDVTT